ncbi:MAG: hypothetical protein M4579_005811 [Chaenotheca gracillima]|nr:MAG: hypothetical protein M4579_005811 [Chaenotheca gracillima]
MSGLPDVKTLKQCASFSLTVLPYVSQLTTFPTELYNILISAASSDNSPPVLTALKGLYLSTNPLISGFAFALFLAPIFLIVSEVNKNYSQVDRLWSILPTLFNAHFSVYGHLAGVDTRRLDMLVAASTVWSGRLTFNYWRKGGYSIGSEDYRWEILRTKISPLLFFVFNVLFIALAQCVLLFSIATPTYILLLTAKVPETETPTADLIISRLLIGLVMLEWFADQQQWTYQNAKKTYKEKAQVPPGYEAEDFERGFNVTGLWAWSRHPNFAAEQGVWIMVYQWSTYVTDVYFNWTLVGCISYVILFQASTWFTELISAGKYPEYKEYQQRVGKFLPRWSTATKDEEKEEEAEIERKAKGKQRAE